MRDRETEGFLAIMPWKMDLCTRTYELASDGTSAERARVGASGGSIEALISGIPGLVPMLMCLDCESRHESGFSVVLFCH